MPKQNLKDMFSRIPYMNLACKFHINNIARREVEQYIVGYIEVKNTHPSKDVADMCRPGLLEEFHSIVDHIKYFNSLRA